MLNMFIERTKAVLGSSRFLVQFAASLHWIWTVPLAPISRTVGAVAVWGWRKYKSMWMRLTHDKYGGFVYWRGGGMAAVTLTSIFMLPTIVLFCFQVAMFVTTQRNEQVYLIQSEEILPNDNIWSVRGCDKLPCNRDSSIYYRIAPTTFNHVWSIFSTGWIFLPDVVGSGVPTGLTRCSVRSYGIRVKALMNRMDIYPDALEISCDAVEQTPVR